MLFIELIYLIQEIGGIHQQYFKVGDKRYQVNISLKWNIRMCLAIFSEELLISCAMKLPLATQGDLAYLPKFNIKKSTPVFKWNVYCLAESMDIHILF